MLWLLALFLCVCAGSPWRAAHAETQRYSFAVVASTLAGPADEAPTQRLLDAIGRERDLPFIVYDGNLKGAHEACRDSLYARRQNVLQTARPALVFIPGEHDWADCGGSFDAVERLDYLRQTLFGDNSSMGQNPLPLLRESEGARFRPYRENVRWRVGNTVFIGLNLPGPNNRYLDAGGRNGEFEDRVIANGFWLEHAAEYARQRHARAIVIFVSSDPGFDRFERRGRFAWLHFGRRQPRDGYLEFKRSLVELARSFHGPVLIVHGDDAHPAKGFIVDQPLRNDKGDKIANLTRVAVALHDRLDQWLQIDVDMTKAQPFHVSVRDVPKQLPMPVEAPAPAAVPAPSMPQIPALPPASELAPVPKGSDYDGPSGGPPSEPPLLIAPTPAAPASDDDSVQRGP